MEGSRLPRFGALKSPPKQKGPPRKGGGPSPALRDADPFLGNGCRGTESHGKWCGRPVPLPSNHSGLGKNGSGAGGVPFPKACLLHPLRPSLSILTHFPARGRGIGFLPLSRALSSKEGGLTSSPVPADSKSAWTAVIPLGKHAGVKIFPPGESPSEGKT